MLQVRVSFLGDSETRRVLVADTGTVRDLKSEILSDMCISESQVEVINMCFKGQLLQEDLSLKGYEIEDNARVVVRLRLRPKDDDMPVRSHSEARLPTLRTINNPTDAVLVQAARSVSEDPDAFEYERLKQVDRQFNQFEMNSVTYRKLITLFKRVIESEERCSEVSTRRSDTVIPDGSAESPSCESLPDCSRRFFTTPGVVKYVRDHKASNPKE